MRNINRMKYHMFFFMLFLQLAGFVSSQQIPFVPPCHNYEANRYSAGNQNWAVAEDKHGIIYVANNKGLLYFDGVNWELEQLPSHLGIKSIFVDSESTPERIYIGSFEEFGYFYYNEFNHLTYQSLKHLASDYPFRNDEIWTINKIGKKIYFQSFSSYFEYDGKAIKSYKPHPAPLFFFAFNDTLYAQQINNDFGLLRENKFQPIIEKATIQNDEIIALLPYTDRIMLLTSSQGIYILNQINHTIEKWHTSIDEKLQKAVINRAVLIDSLYIFGTLNNGIYALDKNGQLQWHLNTKNGLQNNTVLGLMGDTQHNLWVALDNGISMIQTNSDLSFFKSQDVQIGMVEDMIIHNQQLYVASNYGVFKYDKSKKDFIALPDFGFQTWFIRSFDHQVIVGQNPGSSFWEKDKKRPIVSASAGGMDIKRASIHGQNMLIESSYTLLSAYLKNRNGKWVFSHNINGFSDLINHIEVDHTGNIWAGHMYKGVYRLNIDDKLQTVVKQEYFQFLDSVSSNSNPINVMKLRGRIVFTDEMRFYTFDDIRQKIVPYDRLNQDLPHFGDTYRIVSINDTSFWFIRKDEYARVNFQAGKYVLKDKIAVNLLINPPNEGRRNVYVGGKDDASYFTLNEGLCKYQPHPYRDKKKITFQLATAWAFNRKNEKKTHLNPSVNNIIGYNNNNIIFNFRLTDFSHDEEYLIECFLEGYDNRWVATSKKRSITYNNLSAGNYILKTRVSNSFGKVIARKAVDFQIKKPWYHSLWAYLTYGIFIILIIVILIIVYIRIVLSRNNKAFEKKEKERLLQLDKQEKLITQLKNEKLEADLVYKGKELANASMLLINHEKILQQLKNEIQQLVLSGKIPNKQGNQLIQAIQENLSDEDIWTLFEENFDLIHENFFRKLQEKYPNLTPTDLKLCALLRLNYNTKEIAGILNLSTRGVEAGRYRLRKKLNLSEEINLVSFMIDFR